MILYYYCTKYSIQFSVNTTLDLYLLSYYFYFVSYCITYFLYLLQYKFNEPCIYLSTHNIYTFTTCLHC